MRSSIKKCYSRREPEDCLQGGHSISLVVILFRKALVLYVLVLKL